MSNNRAKYRFFLQVNEETAVAVTPYWGGETARVFSADNNANGGSFYRTKVTGKFTFAGIDFNLINNATFQSQFNLIIERYESAVWVEIFKGYFNKTDCEFDLDANNLEVSPERRDSYDDVITGADKEFNFLSLNTKIEEIEYKKHPALQIYSPMLQTISTFVGTTYYETPVTPTEAIDLTDPTQDMKFGSAGLPDETLNLVTGVGGNLNPDVSGVYEVVAATPSGSKFQSLNGQYAFKQVTDGGVLKAAIVDQNDGDAVVYLGATTAGFAFNENRFSLQGFEELVSVTDAESKVQLVRVQTHARLLTDKVSVNGTTTTAYNETTDLTNAQFAYKNILPVEQWTFGVSDNRDATKGRFGKFPDDVANFAGEYYTDLIVPTEATYPLFRSEWRAASVWFNYNDALRDLQEQGGEDLTLRNAYRLSSVISALLGEIAPDITHDETTTFSNFLYNSTNPISGDIQPALFITPATNLKVSEYDRAAERSNIRLGDIFTMLWAVYRVGWYIEDSKLKFEHISFFDNGGSYSAPVVGEDLTQLIESKTGKNWGFNTSKFKYEKQNLPERIISKWSSEKASVPFYGFPIEVQSTYVQKGNIEQRNVPRFYTDIDFMLSNPTEVSDDDIILIGATEAAGVFSVPFLELSTGSNRTYNMQNGYLSFVYLHEKFHRHGLPATDVTINENATTATTTIRTKVQEIDVPLSTNFNPNGLVKTELGNGKLKTATENLSSQTAKLIVLHETE
jgi:hypothetical protein